MTYCQCQLTIIARFAHCLAVGDSIEYHAVIRFGVFARVLLTLLYQLFNGHLNLIPLSIEVKKKPEHLFWLLVLTVTSQSSDPSNQARCRTIALSYLGLKSNDSRLGKLTTQMGSLYAA